MCASAPYSVALVAAPPPAGTLARRTSSLNGQQPKLRQSRHGQSEWTDVRAVREARGLWAQAKGPCVLSQPVLRVEAVVSEAEAAGAANTGGGHAGAGAANIRRWRRGGRSSQHPAVAVRGQEQPIPSDGSAAAHTWLGDGPGSTETLPDAGAQPFSTPGRPFRNPPVAVSAPPPTPHR